MKSKYKLGMNLMPCLLVVSLVCTVAAVFVPYVAEWMLGLTSVCLSGFSLCFCYAASGKLIWSDWVALLVVGVSAILTMLLILGRNLQLFAIIEGLNLLTILGISIALLFRKNANRAALGSMIALCVFSFGFGVYLHIASFVVA